MNDLKLKALVTEACLLDRKIAVETACLDEMKARLKSEAETRTEEHVETDGGGWSWTLEGTDGNVVRVTTPGDALKPSIDGEGKTIEAIRKAAGTHFSRLFLQAPKWKLVPDFRDQAKALLGASAKKLIRLVSKKSKVTVSFETKEVQ